MTDSDQTATVGSTGHGGHVGLRSVPVLRRDPPRAWERVRLQNESSAPGRIDIVQFRITDMATTEKSFETIPVGTKVTWHYRSAIGHGTVIGVHKIGTTADNTMYSIRQHDHHPGEPAVLHHSGKALSIAKS